MQLIISVDFDGTVVEHAFPHIGEPLEDVFEVLKELQDAGHILILNTCREDVGHKIAEQYLTDALEFCKQNGVEFSSANENGPENDFRDDWPLRRKVYAHVYIDDKNLGGFPGWKVVREMLLGE